jgi:hypothetical protein
MLRFDVGLIVHDESFFSRSHQLFVCSPIQYYLFTPGLDQAHTKWKFNLNTLE